MGPPPLRLGISLPEYTVESEPDHATIGKRVDDLLRTHLAGWTIVARGVSATAHAIDADELADIIVTTGTDRYDPERAGDRYDNVDGRHIDFFGMRRTVTGRMRLFEALTWGFYHGAIAVHGDPGQARPAEHLRRLAGSGSAPSVSRRLCQARRFPVPPA